MKYLNENGLLYLVQKIKTWLGGKVDKVDGKSLSTNDYTTEEKTKLAGLENYSLPTASADTLGGVKVGAGLAVNNGVLSATGGGTADSVDWSNVQNKPTKVSDFTNDAKYQTESDVEAKGQELLNSVAEMGYQTASDVEKAINAKVSSVMSYKGTVASYTDLPTNATIGDTYNITNSSEYNKAGDNAVWNGTGWDVLSGTIDLSNYYTKSEMQAITNAEIDTICA